MGGLVALASVFPRPCLGPERCACACSLLSAPSFPGKPGGPAISAHTGEGSWPLTMGQSERGSLQGTWVYVAHVGIFSPPRSCICVDILCQGVGEKGV